jgi:hypothetical protein
MAGGDRGGKADRIRLSLDQYEGGHTIDDQAGFVLETLPVISIT